MRLTEWFHLEVHLRGGVADRATAPQNITQVGLKILMFFKPVKVYCKTRLLG